jgi:hypothetical protein
MQEMLGGEDALDQVVTELRKYEGWPADDVRDRQFVAELKQKYPHIVLLDEAYQWRTWMLDHNQKREVKPRARFVRWVVNAATFRSEREAARKDRKNKSRTAPAGREQFGEHSSLGLAGW